RTDIFRQPVPAGAVRHTLVGRDYAAGWSVADRRLGHAAGRRIAQTVTKCPVSQITLHCARPSTRLTALQNLTVVPATDRLCALSATPIARAHLLRNLRTEHWSPRQP